MDFDLRFNRDGDGVETMLDKDVKHVVKPQLADVKSQMVVKYHGIQDELFAAKATADRTHSECSDAKDAIVVLEQTCARAEAALNADKAIWAEKSRAAQADVDQLEARLHQLKTADSSTLAESQRTMEDLHAEYASLSQKLQTEKAKLNEMLLLMTSELADHREYTRANLEALSSKADDVLKEVSLADEA
eukprot:SAG31_NODE_2836_length_5019_cov_2.059350_7_plen_190_part_00